VNLLFSDGSGPPERQGKGRKKEVEEPVVQVVDLVKRYGELEAVRGINFEVRPGETFGFLGPNGAGKSTTIKILCTLANPTSGSARVAGYDVRRQRDTVRRNIGLVFQDPTLDSYLTGEQNLRFHADLYGVTVGLDPRPGPRSGGTSTT
jgi:ABC-2 type transport system ATP-binding protein